MIELAETIARLEKTHGNLLRNSNDQAFVSYVDLRALLACARRCEAIEQVGSHVIGRALNALDCCGRAPDGKIYANIEADDLRVLVDAASERDALAKRVVELERAVDKAKAATKALASDATRLDLVRYALESA